MFTKTKSDTPQGFSPAQDAVRGASSKPASRVGASILCSDVEIKGSVKSQGALQIDGKVEGDERNRLWGGKNDLPTFRRRCLFFVSYLVLKTSFCLWP